eukprot:CAMPEP_0202047436 /NCGR_PEP_ID=MMETSP0963-20130614/1955_1 /ASSEMBLY_ACC=CAM_ASM_000494 /TAXON_ID=4773 /ORGANISM="Schizochytrium aggregatum, Strain ATCC28209" /LENGTH=143 /DNA_ID=CAMNT_0048612183 /DNA_START=49 /DNA_END=479 /DNA_ORIENTATION=-
MRKGGCGSGRRSPDYLLRTVYMPEAFREVTLGSVAVPFWTGPQSGGPVVTFGAPAKPQHLPLALAVQWAKVNPFTPDHTGAKLFPAAHSALPAYELETSGSEPAVDEVSSDSTLERPDRTSMSVLEKVVQAVPGPVPGQMRKK